MHLPYLPTPSEAFFSSSSIAIAEREEIALVMRRHARTQRFRAAITARKGACLVARVEARAPGRRERAAQHESDPQQGRHLVDLGSGCEKQKDDDLCVRRKTQVVS